MCCQEERKIIHDCYETIYKLTGIAPIGWHTRSSTSPYTRKLLIEHGGFLYDSNAYNDDLPYSLKLENKKYIIRYILLTFISPALPPGPHKYWLL